MDEFKKAFARVATKYAEYVEAKVIYAAKPGGTPAQTPRKLARELQDEVRTVNVLAVTLARMKAQDTGELFGVNAGI